MVVQTHSQDGRFIGLHIGQDNVRRHFSPQCPSIELLLGHLHIDCQLDASFWLDQPLICDSRLADWLESQCHGHRRGDCVSLTMSRISDTCFRVETSKSAPSSALSNEALDKQPAAASSGSD